MLPIITFAQSDVGALQSKINSHQEAIKNIEKDIKKYSAQLNTISRKKRTLKTAMQELDLSRKKVGAQISLTQDKIAKTTKSLTEINADIATKEEHIQKNQKALAETVQRMYAYESQSLLETILGKSDISNIWNDIDTMQQFQVDVRSSVKRLESQRKTLEIQKKRKEDTQNELLNQKRELSTHKHSLDINRSAKNRLLKETANRESTYQKILAQKKKAKAEFEAQLRDFESQLKYILDPTSIPPAGKGVFRWPLDVVHITQYFGNTKFASTGAYNGKGHNGIDMGTPIGTPVKAVLAGNVKATGNTDAYKGCYSYGKWILIEHVNGLSTLYAHLSEIVVNKGDPVATGSVIGYSGNTGYSTGPHLHFTTYASDAVKIVRLGDIKKYTHCPNARIPVASWSGYLNPLNYLK